jgi:hypothetical protein
VQPFLKFDRGVGDRLRGDEKNILHLQDRFPAKALLLGSLRVVPVVTRMPIQRVRCGQELGVGLSPL